MWDSDTLGGSLWTASSTAVLPLNGTVDAAAFLLSALLGVMLCTGMAMAARRLLGLQFGPLRMMSATLLGWLIGTATVGILGPPADQGVLVAAMIGAALTVTMILLVGAELVLPNRSGPGDWGTNFRRRLHRLRRYVRVLSIIYRHRLFRLVTMKSGRRSTPAARQQAARSLRLALEECGVTLIKFGQALSTRHDMLAPEFTTELSSLHDNVPPAVWAEVEQVLTADLGAPPDEVFDEFDIEPIAAASIAQVHCARLHSGESVVVKVLRPGIRAAVQNDLNIIARLGRTLEARTAWGQSIGTTNLADGFSTALLEELDFTVEAGNILAITESTAARRSASSVRLPVVHKSLCTSRVLVMERLHGVSLGSIDTGGTRPDLDRHGLATQLLRCVLEQIVLDGVFHCDPHPGNVLLLDDGGLGLLDFGVVGRLDATTRSAIQQLLLAIERRDRAALCDALLEVVDRPVHLDEVSLERALGRFMALHLSAGRTPGMEMFVDLFRIIKRYGLTVPPEAAAVFRTLTTLEGTLAGLAPGFDLVSEARSYAHSRHVGVPDVSDLPQIMMEELWTLVPLLRRFPRRMDRIMTQLDEGRIGVNVHLFGHERDRGHVTELVHLTLMAFLAAANGITAALLLGLEHGPRLTPNLPVLDLLGYIMLAIGGILILRVLARIFRAGR